MIRLEGAKIAQSAVQGIGMSAKEIRGSWTNNPNYALLVSMLFTRATNQTIILGTPPDHVLSTSILCSCLLHDSRFRQVPLGEAAPGDIVIASHPTQAEGYAGIVVDHGRIVSGSRQGVQNNSSLVEIQRAHPEMVLFRYIGVQGRRSHSLANAGFDPNEPRVPAGQSGGGQWTAEMVPSTTILSGGNKWPVSSRTGTNTPRAEADKNPKGAAQAPSDGETYTSLLAKVFQAIDAGGQHPTPAQREDFGKACDAWQRYVVSHGMSPFVAGEQLQNIIHNYCNPGSGPNPGSEGVLGFQQGQAAGAGAGGIVAGAIVGVSTSQKSSAWSMGPGPRGLAIESELGGNLPKGFPGVDRFENGVVTSIKSIDLHSPSYQNTRALANTLENYTDKVASFNGATRGIRKIESSEITARQLQIAIPPGSMSPAQKAAFAAAAVQAQSKGVTITVTEIH